MKGYVMEGDSSDCVGLDAACKVLAKIRSVQTLIKTAVGAGKFQEALRLMKSGNLEGKVGGELHDLLSDTIRNEAVEAWRGVIHQPHDDYSVQVSGYHGVYWVWAGEYDPVGYFLDQHSAISYAKATWEVSEDDDVRRRRR
jgi:hypothetical protein